MNPTARFVELVAQPAERVPLDEAAALIAAHDHRVDVPGLLARLDDLAAGAPVGIDASALGEFLFRERGLTGNTVDYADPRNSYLDEVLERRLGIPITLSVVMLEVGRRVGLELVGVGMPGHFLVGAGDGLFIDPFRGGVALDVAGCRDRFLEVRGAVPFSPRFLAAVDTPAILARMLANLVATFMVRSPGDAVWALRLRASIEGLAVAERREAATLLGELGRFDEAAVLLEQLSAEVDRLDEATARRARESAARLRARAN